MDLTVHTFWYVDLYMDRTIHILEYVDVARGRGGSPGGKASGDGGESASGDVPITFPFLQGS